MVGLLVGLLLQTHSSVPSIIFLVDSGGIATGAYLYLKCQTIYVSLLMIVFCVTTPKYCPEGAYFLGNGITLNNKPVSTVTGQVFVRTNEHSLVDCWFFHCRPLLI
jgi:hypothetical protein